MLPLHRLTSHVVDLFRRRTATAAIVIVAATTLGLAMERNELKRIDRVDAPWHLDQAGAVDLTWQPRAGRSLRQLDRLVASRACLGAAVGVDEPSYLLFGPGLDRTVVFLPQQSTPHAAASAGVPYVVIGGKQRARTAAGFEKSGWAIRPLRTSPDRPYWTLAINPTGGSGHCHSLTAIEQAKALLPA